MGKILVEGNESFTGGDILRRLARAGFKVVRLKEGDHEYMAGLVRCGERFRLVSRAEEVQGREFMNVALARIEFHPENGIAPHVVVVPTHDGGAMWFAYQTQARAEEKRGMIEAECNRHDGIIELDGPHHCQYHGPETR